jgi:hypothetical protein
LKIHRALRDFFEQVYPLLKNRIVLITGDSDLSVPYEEHLPYITNHSKIIKWFGSNPSKRINSQKFRYQALPLGINCNTHAKTIRELDYHNRYVKYGINYIDERVKIFEEAVFNVTGHLFDKPPKYSPLDPVLTYPYEIILI